MLLFRLCIHICYIGNKIKINDDIENKVRSLSLGKSDRLFIYPISKYAHIRKEGLFLFQNNIDLLTYNGLIDIIIDTTIIMDTIQLTGFTFILISSLLTNIFS